MKFTANISVGSHDFFCRYNKTENLIAGTKDMFLYTHLIAEGKSKFSTNLQPYSGTHDIIDVIESFHQVSFNYFTIPPVKIKVRPALYILQRKDVYKDYINTQNNVEVHEKDANSIEDHKESTTNIPEEIVTEFQSKEAVEDETGESKMVDRQESENVETEEKRRLDDVPLPNLEHSLNFTIQEKPRILKKLSDSDSKLLKSEEKTKERRTKNSVKDNIKHIINKFKISKFENLTSAVDLPINREGGKTKEYIKNIIKQEKLRLEQEELNKIHEQIISLIDNNSNIINKEAIKDRLSDAFNNMDSTAIEVSSKKTVETEQEENYVEQRIKAPSKTEKNLVPNTEFVGHMEFDESGRARVEDFERQFEAANEQIENIMRVIENIVSNIEVQEERGDERE